MKVESEIEHRLQQKIKEAQEREARMKEVKQIDFYKNN